MSWATQMVAKALEVIPKNGTSRLVGKVADQVVPPRVLSPVVSAFVKVYDVDLSEVDVPHGGFRSFNDFFTRRLHDNARAVDDCPLTSPADGCVAEVGPVDKEGRFFIKGRHYRLDELLAESSLADKFHGGEFAVIYLSPRDYHRVHAATAGNIRAMRYAPGTLYPVNRIGTDHVDRLFARNERVIMRQEHEDLGTVATVMVGAIGVGKVTVVFDDIETNQGQGAVVREYGDDGPPMEQGEELGAFHIGSTVILFLEKQSTYEFDLQEDQVLRVGQRIAKKRVQVGNGIDLGSLSGADA